MPAAPPPTRARARAAAAVGLMAVLAGVALFVAPVHEAVGHAAHGDTAALKRQLRAAGAAGVVLLYALMLAHIVLPFPAEVTNLVAGFA